jgi:hypothetical protein
MPAAALSQVELWAWFGNAIFQSRSKECVWALGEVQLQSIVSFWHWLVMTTQAQASVRGTVEEGAPRDAPPFRAAPAPPPDHIARSC